MSDGFNTRCRAERMILVPFVTIGIALYVPVVCVCGVYMCTCICSIGAIVYWKEVEKEVQAEKGKKKS